MFLELCLLSFLCGTEEGIARYNLEKHHQNIHNLQLIGIGVLHFVSYHVTMRKVYSVLTVFTKSREQVVKLNKNEA